MSERKLRPLERGEGGGRRRGEGGEGGGSGERGGKERGGGISQVKGPCYVALGGKLTWQTFFKQQHRFKIPLKQQIKENEKAISATFCTF